MHDEIYSRLSVLEKYGALEGSVSQPCPVTAATLMYIII